MADNPSPQPEIADSAVIRLHADDNVGVARCPLAAGREVRVGGRRLTVREPVPAGHKVALKPIPAGGRVVRYGHPIGRATTPIEAGAHVHVHNVELPEAGPGFSLPERELPPPAAAGPGLTFPGYLRPDGRVGTRNYIAVVPASNCSAYTAERVARSFPKDSLPAGVDGVVAFSHGFGCTVPLKTGNDPLRRTLAGLMDHPNVAGALILGLGCEINQVELYLGEHSGAGRPVAGLTIQQAGGTRAAVAEARRRVRRMVEEAAQIQRTDVPLARIVLGLQCGGSDAFSGITANPALGRCSDLVVAAGGTVVLGETPETFGAEQRLVDRCRNRAVARAYLRLVEQYQRYLEPFGSTFDDNPSPGNKAGGLTNILEKSLGAVAKAGTTPITAAVDYAERVAGPGVVFMNTPGNDPISLSGIVAGGANLIAFTTGRGSVTGFPTVPVLKIASHSALYEHMKEDMDVNAGRIADGEATVDEVGREIFGRLLGVAAGETTASERLGHDEFVPWVPGPVL